MTRFKCYGLGGVAAFLLLACGGTVDLQDGSGGTGGTGASGGTLMSGGSGGSGGTAIVGVGAVGGGGNGTAGSGEDDVFSLPNVGGLVFDRDVNGLGRALFLRSFGNDACTQQLTDPATQAKQATFSPDASKLAYAALVDGTYQIEIMDVASGETEVVTQLAVGATSPAFSPNGKLLAYVSGDPEPASNRLPGSGDLLVQDLESGEAKTLLSGESLGCCTQQALSPAFITDEELVVGTTMSMLRVNVATGASRDLVPLTGRIPNPQDPSLAPDGLRYVFSDYCGDLSLYVARVDGSTGDTCASAKAIGGGRATSADWGRYGYLAAQTREGIMLVQDSTFRIGTLPDSFGAKNPVWTPEHLALRPHCD